MVTLMCLSIGTPKNNKFSICPKWKIHYFQVSQNLGRVQPHYNLLGHLKIINFPFETKGKLKILGVPILKHFRVGHFAASYIADINFNDFDSSQRRT